MWLWCFKTESRTNTREYCKVPGFRDEALKRIGEENFEWTDLLSPSWPEKEAINFFNLYCDSAGIVTSGYKVDIHCPRKAGALIYAYGSPARTDQNDGTLGSREFKLLQQLSEPPTASASISTLD